MVCTIWRTSIPQIPIPIIISSLFFRQPNPHRFIPNGIYLLKNQSLSFILSLQESEPDKFLLSHPLTYKPMFESSVESLHSLVSGWTVTRLALFHSLKKSKSKPCFIPLFHSSSDKKCKVYKFRDLILFSKRNPESNYSIQSFVNFCGCTYAVNQNDVYLVNQFGSKRLICVNPSSKPRNPSIYNNRFVVSDGDLYLVFNLNACVPLSFKASFDHQCRIYIYKLIMDDLKRPSSYAIERVTSLGDRALFFNWNFSFSIGTRHPLLANRIFVSDSAFCSRCGSKDGGFHVYSPRGNVIRIFRSTLGLFEPPPMWTQQLNAVAKPKPKLYNLSSAR